MKVKNDEVMTLPDKEFLRIEEVAAMWRNASGVPVKDVDIFDYIKQGVLPAYILHKKKFYLVPSSELSSFDEYIKDNSTRSISFRNCSFVPPSPNLFDETVSAQDVLVRAQDVYVKQKDMSEYEESAGGSEPVSSHDDEKSNNLPEKPLGAVERKKLHLIIMALVELADLSGEKLFVIAKNIGYKTKVSENTIAKHVKAAQETKRKELD